MRMSYGNKVKNKPVVFTCVSDPIAAGAGSSRTQHLPLVTGVGSFPQVEHHLDLMLKLVPGLRAVDLPFRVDGNRSSRWTPPPKLGEHTDEVLGELGYDHRAITKLRAAGTIA